MELFRADPRANFAYANYYFWDGQRDESVGYRTNRPLPDGDTARRLAWANVYALSSIMVRRAVFARTGDFDPGLDNCEDWDMWLRLAEQDFRARGTREPLVRYRRWAGSMSAKKIKMVRHNLIVLEKNLRATRRPELRPVLPAKPSATTAPCWNSSLPGSRWRPGRSRISLPTSGAHGVTTRTG